jgi:stage II sporulation protein D
MRRIVLLTFTFLLLVPAASQAAVRIVVRGGGFGHGIGLSQYGAYGYAQHQFSYRQILSRYYRGTDLGRAGQRTVRVLLQSSDPYVRFRGATRIGSKSARPDTTYVARSSGGVLAVSASGGKRLGRFTSPLKVSTSRAALRLLGPAGNGVRDGLYRGSLLLSPAGSGGVTAVNALGLDSYVKGVVPGEMPSSWLQDALRAQAVVARTYALATIKPGAVFDLYPDTRSQVYRGASGEAASTNTAVEATGGQVLTYGGRVAITYYFSTSGGETENNENVFLSALPQAWLRGVEDPFDDISPRHRWRFSFSPGQLQARLGSYVLGRFRTIRVLSRGVSPRIIRARVYGSGGTRIITGPTLRSRLGLYDSWAYFSRVSSSQARAKSVAAALAVSRTRLLELVGRFDPAPRGRRILLEQRIGGRWTRLRGARTSRRGGYAVRVAARGVYRMRAGSVAGPAVRVR